MLKRGALIGMIAAILGIGGAAAVGSTAVAKPTSKAATRSAPRRPSPRPSRPSAGPSADSAPLDARRSHVPAARHPRGTRNARQPRRPRHAALLRGSRVPGLQVLRRPHTAHADQGIRAAGEAQDRIPFLQELHARTVGLRGAAGGRTWQPASRTRCGTSSSSSTTSRAAWTRTVSTKAPFVAWRSRSPDSTSPNGGLRAVTRASPNRSRATRRPATATTGNRPRTSFSATARTWLRSTRQLRTERLRQSDQGTPGDRRALIAHLARLRRGPAAFEAKANAPDRAGVSLRSIAGPRVCRPPRHPVRLVVPLV